MKISGRFIKGAFVNCTATSLGHSSEHVLKSRIPRMHFRRRWKQMNGVGHRRNKSRQPKNRRRRSRRRLQGSTAFLSILSRWWWYRRVLPIIWPGLAMGASNNEATKSWCEEEATRLLRWGEEMLNSSSHSSSPFNYPRFVLATQWRRIMITRRRTILDRTTSGKTLQNARKITP